ncbi:transposase, partial [Holospora undulata]|uniref:transposase n=1 Tax=Holospora undulata TaxID=1169117 RepID=UPI00094B222B
IRKRHHSGVDRQGNLLHITTVHKANDTGAGCRVFKEAVQKYSTLNGVCADAGYRNPMEEFVRNSIE